MAHNDNATQTYLALRFGLVLLVALLGLSVLFQALTSMCVQHSISAYYFTSARPVFIGALCAVGVCLIMYRGNTNNENVLLDYSGFMAFVVAFVPTEIDRTCTASNVPSPQELAAAVKNNVFVLLVVAVIAALAAWKVKWLRQNPADKLPAAARWTLGATFVLLAIGCLVFFLARDLFQAWGHNVAAIFLFAGIVAVVVENAVGLARKLNPGVRLTWREVIANRYGGMAIAMAATLVVCVVVGWLGFRHWIIGVEALLILEFAVFWGMQTNELKGAETRKELPAVTS